MKTIYHFFCTLPNWVFLMLFMLCEFLYVAQLGTQGLGMQDEGWVLTAYQQIFLHPQSVSYNFLYYNGVLVGGIWNLLFGSFGIYAFRILEALVAAAKVFVVWLILEKYINRYAIATGIFVLLFCSYWIGGFAHNSLTLLLCLCVILFIMRALETKKMYYIFIAGVIAGINIFTRIPNIAQLGLILVLIPFYLYTKNIRLTFLMLMMAILGVALGVLMEIVLMYNLGHLNIFIENISSGLSAASENDSTHNLSSMFGMYYGQLMEIIAYCGLFLLLPAIWQILSEKYKNRWTMYVVCGLFCLLCMYIAFAISMGRRLLWAGMLLVLTFFILHNISNREPEDDNRFYLVVLSLLMFLFIPLGSDWGYESGITLAAATLALPVGVGIVCNKFRLSDFKQPSYMYGLSLGLMITIVSINGLHKASLTTGEESGSRLKKIYRIDNNLATVYTRKESAELLNPLLHNLSEYVKPGDKLLCFQSLAMIHYLTQTQPYLENAWPWTYTSEEMERHFKKARNESTKLPVIVREKSWVAEGWRIPYKDWDNSEAVENRFHKNRKIKLIQDFIRDNGYTVHWENDVFQILLPPIK